MEDTKRVIKAYLLQEFFPGEKSDALTDSTHFITGGLLDSVATLKLVTFLEEQYGIEIKAYEVDAEHLDTLPDIASFVLSKV